MITYIKGDLIELAKEGMFDVIAHNANCMCSMPRGIANAMHRAFGCANPSFYPLESTEYKGDMNKLGQIQASQVRVAFNQLTNRYKRLDVVNAYCQYEFSPVSKPFCTYAFTLVARKLNHAYRGKKIGLPKIGTGRGGADWAVVEFIIEQEMSGCNVTIVEYDKTETQ